MNLLFCIIIIYPIRTDFYVVFLCLSLERIYLIYLVLSLKRILPFSFVDDLFIAPDDLLGDFGPMINEFLLSNITDRGTAM